MKNFPITVNYLEIFSKENVNPKSVVRNDLKISKVKEPDPEFARWFYRSVGKEWYWVDQY